MTLYGLIFAAGVSFLFLCLVFWPLEAAFPANARQRFFRPAWWTDLCFFLGQYLLWTGGVLWILARFAGWIDHVMPAGFPQTVASQPWWLQADEGIFLSDYFGLRGH